MELQPTHSAVTPSLQALGIHDQLHDLVCVLGQPPVNGSFDAELIPTYKLLRLYERLLDIPEYRSVIYAAIHARNSSRSTSCQTLIANTSIRADILTVRRERPIPLHDHPGSSGILLVLSGSISVDQYDVVCGQDDYDGKTLVELRRVSCKELGLGGVSLFRGDWGNVHSVRALTEKSVILDIVTPPCRRQERSWFFPLPVNPAGDRRIFAKLPSRAAIESLLIHSQG